MKFKTILILDSLVNLDTMTESAREEEYDKASKAGVDRPSIYRFLNVAANSLSFQYDFNKTSMPYFHLPAPQQTECDCAVYVMYFAEKVLECYSMDQIKSLKDRKELQLHFQEYFPLITIDHKLEIPTKRLQIESEMKKLEFAHITENLNVNSFLKENSQFIERFLKHDMKYGVELINFALGQCNSDFTKTKMWLNNDQKVGLFQEHFSRIEEQKKAAMTKENNARLEKWIHNLKKKIIPVEADGNCFFRTIAYHLYGDDEKYQTVRDAVIDEITKNKHLYEECFHSHNSLEDVEGDVPIERFKDFDSYLSDTKRGMSRAGVFANHLEILAASRQYKAKILIYADTMGESSDNLKPNPVNFPGDENYEREIEISQHSNNHFNIVINVLVGDDIWTHQHQGEDVDRNVPTEKSFTVVDKSGNDRNFTLVTKSWNEVTTEEPPNTSTLPQSTEEHLKNFVASQKPKTRGWRLIPQQWDHFFGNMNFLWCECLPKSDPDGQCQYYSVVVGIQGLNDEWFKARHKLASDLRVLVSKKFEAFIKRGGDDREAQLKVILQDVPGKDRHSFINKDTGTINYPWLTSQIETEPKQRGDDFTLSIISEEKKINFIIWHEGPKSYFLFHESKNDSNPYMVLLRKSNGHYRLLGYYDETSEKVRTLLTQDDPLDKKIINHLRELKKNQQERS